MAEIVQAGDPVLKRRAVEVPKADFGSKLLGQLLAEMRRTLDSQDDGVALAAPQIAVSLRIFVVSPKIFEDPKKARHLIYINPKITARSKKKLVVPEGCLSVRGVWGETKRSEKVTVEAYDEHGKKFVRSGTELLAQIFQHEIDHLDGILFVDHAKNLQKVEPTND